MNCERCPVPAASACRAHLCRLAGSPEWDRHILALARAGGPPAPPAAGRAAAGGAGALLADLRRVRACPHWRDGTDTPCGCHRCALGRGSGGVVTPRECLDCPDLPSAG